MSVRPALEPTPAVPGRLALFATRPLVAQSEVHGLPVPPTRHGVTLSALADSYLYLGPRSSLTRSTINPAICHGDEPLLNPLRRRLDMFPGGAPFKVEDLIAEGDPRFFTD